MEDKAPMTMKDIAREFGISVATVSRALKDSPRISEERRKAIQQYARDHNFYPNAIGEALRHSRVMPQRVIRGGCRSPRLPYHGGTEWRAVRARSAYL